MLIHTVSVIKINFLALIMQQIYTKITCVCVR